MTKNLHTADTVVKLILSVLILIFYFTEVISGPLAVILVFLAVVVIVLFTIKLFYNGFSGRE